MSNAEAVPGLRSQARPGQLARVLSAEIQTGRYDHDSRFPTEVELRKRFDASRYAIREALQLLKEQGLLWSRPGVGTVVRSRSGEQRQMKAEGSLRDLIQFVEATRMQVLDRGTWKADAAWAELHGGKAEQEWSWASVLRRVPGRRPPIAIMQLFMRPEHGSVIDLIDASREPVFALLQRHHQVDITEVRQRIIGTIVDAALAKTLQVEPGTPALHIARQYLDESGRVALLSIGQYPGERFAHEMSFRISPRSGFGDADG